MTSQTISEGDRGEKVRVGLRETSKTSVPRNRVPRTEMAQLHVTEAVEKSDSLISAEAPGEKIRVDLRKTSETSVPRNRALRIGIA